jgi:hypothetical protein
LKGEGEDIPVAPKRKGSKVGADEEGGSSLLKRTVSTWRRSMPSIDCTGVAQSAVVASERSCAGRGG